MGCTVLILCKTGLKTPCTASALLNLGLLFTECRECERCWTSVLAFVDCYWFIFCVTVTVGCYAGFCNCNGVNVMCGALSVSMLVVCVVSGWGVRMSVSPS